MIDLRRTFVENWPIKLASMIMAMTMWFYVTSKGKTELSLSVPLELRNIPSAMAVVGDVPARVEVRLQGQERLLRDITTGRKVLGVVDLAGAREGQNLVSISPDSIRRPAGVAVTHIAPSEIAVKLERIVQRTVRLYPVVQGRPAPGYRYTGASARPAHITLEGPSSIVQGFSRILTMPIDISGIAERTEVVPRIDYQGKPVRILEQGITVVITVQKEHS